MSEKFSVVLTGKLADGFELPEVMDNIAQVFKLAPEKVEKLFGGKPVALKRGVEKSQAMKLRNVLARAGALGVIKADVIESEVATETAVAVVETEAPGNTATAHQKSIADITCPRCGHQQAHSSNCGLCKMDLSLHLQRIKRREKMLAKRR